MPTRDNVARFIQAIRGAEYDTEEIKEFIVDTRNEEIRSVSKDFIELCHLLTEDLVKKQRSIEGINIISISISKLQQHKLELTPLHSDLCKLCLDAKCYNPALDILEIDYTEIKNCEIQGDSVKYVLLFYYYGGLICAAMKRFERAAHYFETVVTIPANVLTPITKAAYKKLILVNILLNRKISEQPKYTTQHILRQVKKISQTYLKFAEEYSLLNMEKIRQNVVKNSTIFTEDENMGLINQCLVHMQRKCIFRLAKTFSTLPLNDVAEYVGLQSEKEAEMCVRNMIDNGEIYALINQKDGMVVFLDDTEKYDSARVFQELQEDMASTITLISTLKRMNPGDV